jgi:rubrerythrin
LAGRFAASWTQKDDELLFMDRFLIYVWGGTPAWAIEAADASFVTETACAESRKIKTGRHPVQGLVLLFAGASGKKGELPMVTPIGNESSVGELLGNLCRLDYAASEAYDDAIRHIDDAESKARLVDFRADHVRHTEDLGRLLQEMGEDIPSGGGMKSMLTQGKVMLASLMGDRQVLQAMSTNETDTNTAYERAVRHPGVAADVLAVLERNLADERRHKQWLDSRIQILARAA